MPSSSWHLIRPSTGEAGQASSGRGAGTEGISAAAGEPVGSVLRGQGRSGSSARSHAAAGGTAAVPALAVSAEEAAQFEEVRRLGREAEDRGYETGRKRAEAELRASVEGAAALAERLHAMAPERTSEIAHSIAELALSVAKRIVQHEVRIEPSLLCAALEAAVSTINGSPEAHVLLNPAAVQPVAQAWEALHGRAYLGKKWFFEGDPTLPPGGCSVRYEHGFVEAGLEAQLEEIGIALDRAIPNIARGTVEEEVA